MDNYHIRVISNFIRDKETFLNLICINRKYLRLIYWYNQNTNQRNFSITINSPFKNEKLFPNNPGPKKNNWSILFINQDNKITNQYRNDDKYLTMYIHSRDVIKEDLEFKYKNVVTLIIRTYDKFIFSNWSFSNLIYLQTIIFPKDMTYICNKANCLFNLRTVVLPDNLNKILNSFNLCVNLTYIKAHSMESYKLPLKLIDDSFNCTNIKKHQLAISNCTFIHSCNQWL